MFHLYGLILGIAVVSGLSIAERIDKRVSKIFPWVMLGGLLGARIYHVIDYFDFYVQNPAQILAVWNGGLGIWGGVLGGYIAFMIVCYKLKFTTLDQSKILGAMVVALPLSQAIGRLGNYFNGEFINLIWLMPWWSLEAIFNLALFSILWRLNLRGLSSQLIVGAYLVGYGSIRFVLEFWRSDSWKWGELGVAQWISLVSIVIGLWLWQLKNVQE